MSDENESVNPAGDDSTRGKGHLGELLTVSNQEKRDLRLVSRAVKSKWPIKSASRLGLVNRLLKIVDKEAVSIVTKEGGIEFAEHPADVNAIAAARVLVAMVGQNVAQEKAANEPPQQPTTINVGVHVDNRIDERRAGITQIAERVRANRLSGDDSGG